MSLDRREFLKGLVGAWMATHIVPDVYGLSDTDVTLMLPDDTVPGVYRDLMVRIHGNTQTVVWPSNVKWPNSGKPALSKGEDVVHFETWNGGKEWYGTYALDLQ